MGETRQDVLSFTKEKLHPTVWRDFAFRCYSVQCGNSNVFYRTANAGKVLV